jgi:hypothetical protein
MGNPWADHRATVEIAALAPRALDSGTLTTVAFPRISGVRSNTSRVFVSFTMVPSGGD